MPKGKGRPRPSFRPLKNGEKRKNKDGSYSTEVITTIYAGKTGNSMKNIPTLWANPRGGFKQMGVREAASTAKNYEKRTGKTFPTYPNAKTAVDAAKKRSASGGISKGPLAYYGSKGPKKR